MEEAQKSLMTRIDDLNQSDSWFEEKPIELEWFGARWVPGELEENHPLITTLQHNFVKSKGTSRL